MICVGEVSSTGVVLFSWGSARPVGCASVFDAATTGVAGRAVCLTLQAASSSASPSSANQFCLNMNFSRVRILQSAQVLLADHIIPFYQRIYYRSYAVEWEESFPLQTA